MFNEYLKTSLRNIYKNKLSSIVNILGLYIGLTCSVLIMLWVQNELSFDKFHKNYKTIYRIISINSMLASPQPLAPIIKNEIPEIINTTRLLYIPDCNLEYNKILFKDKPVLIDGTFFEMFSFPFIEGNPETVLQNPSSMVVSEEMADRIFGNRNSIGQNVSILLAGKKMEFTVTGIFKNFPANSHLQASYFVSMADFFGQLYGGTLQDWSDWAAVTYLQTTDNCNLESLKNDIVQCMHRHSNNIDYDIEQLQALRDIHLHSNFKNEYASLGDIKYVYIFSVIAFIIILIGCINYINLTTSLAIRRFKEIGIKKSFGAARMTLIKQFTFESLFTVFIALCIAFLFIKSLIPYFNLLTDRELHFTHLDIPVILLIVICALLIGILAGLFPALYLSSFDPVDILQSKTENPKEKFSIRKILTVLQFALSIVVIIGAIVVKRQVDYMQTLDLGFDKSNLVYFRIMNNSPENIKSVKDELLRHPGILNVTSGYVLAAMNKQGTDNINWEGKDPNNYVRAYVHRVDYDFQKTYRVNMVDGRFFSEDFPTDKTSAYVLNEAAVRSFGLESPVGKTISLWGKSGKIIGVIDDYHYETAHQIVSPAILWMNTSISFQGFEGITLRISPLKSDETIKFAQDIIQQHNNGYTSEYEFVESSFKDKYNYEKRLSAIFAISSALAIFISCIGLFALVSFTIKKRTKEIGIRKVNGAPIISILVILLKDIIFLTGIAFILASPVAWFVCSRWLQNFAYHTAISWWIFGMAGLFTIGIALLMVFWQSWRAATRNPVEALRYE
jgi:putative ABC transport system permease protein